MKKLNYLIVIIIFAISPLAFASKFKGYNKSVNAPTMTLNESVMRFEESDSDFLIAFTRNAALYRFPKEKEHAAQIREFLRKMIKDKQQVTAMIDPTTARILSLED